MLDLYHYTDKEIDQIVSSMIILVDSREKEGKNTHILDFFDKKGIKYKKKTLEFADYSFFIPENKELGIMKPLYFDKEIVLERKMGLEEISNNLTKERARFEKELIMAPKNKVILIENATYSDIIKGNYDTKYAKKSFLASLHTFWHRYSAPIFFMPDKSQSGVFIKFYFEYYLRNLIK